MKPKKKEFTPAEVKQIRESWIHTGKSEGQIYLLAELYDCTPNDVRGVLGLKPGTKREDNKNPHEDLRSKTPKRLPEAETAPKREALRRALLAGSTPAAAAAQAGMSVSTAVRTRAELVKDGLLEPAGAAKKPAEEPAQADWVKVKPKAEPAPVPVQTAEKAAEPAQAETKEPELPGTDAAQSPAEKLPETPNTEDGKADGGETHGFDAEQLQQWDEEPAPERTSPGLRMMQEAYRMKRAATMLMWFAECCDGCLTAEDRRVLKELMDKAERFADGVAWAGRTLYREEWPDAER